MKISGNTILITGGATGIGFALAEAFHNAGNTVIICGRRQDRLDQAREKLPGLQTVSCDVGDDRDRNHLVDWIKANHPNLNILVNNAGVQRDIDFTQGPAALEGPSELQINLEGPVTLTALLVPTLRNQSNAAIVNVSSGMVFRPSSRMPLYSTTKTALHVFSTLVREQLAPLGIEVFEAIPPMILDTELNPEGRAKARALDTRPDHVRFANMIIPTSAEYANSVLDNMANGVPEFGFSMSEESRKRASQMKAPGPALDNEVLDRLITARRSVRVFKDDIPDKDLIVQIIEAGRQAPYAGLANRGTDDFRHFFVLAKESPAVATLRSVASRIVRDKLARFEEENKPRMQNMLQAMRMISEKGMPPWSAPWLIIIAERKGYPARESQSLACILENMWLKTTSLGLGMQLISAINDLEDSAELADLTGLPVGEYAFDACQIGWPVPEPRAAPREEPKSSVTWIES